LKEIRPLEISKIKPIFIAAGESHSAAITQKYKLYTWGVGSFGRLGHGYDLNEKKPKLVEELEGLEVTFVSCGAFHTLACTAEGQVYAFGQGKYGKLGVNRGTNNEGMLLNPKEVEFYSNSPSGNPKVDSPQIIQVKASYNHSMALANMDKRGRVISPPDPVVVHMGLQRKRSPWPLIL